MKSVVNYRGLVGFLASLAAVHQVSALVNRPLPRSLSSTCHTNSFPGPVNPSFESGMTGWTIVNGTAFGSASFTDSTSYWGGPFNQVGNTFLWGYAQSGDPTVGTVRSTTFQASNVMSFLVGGGWDSVNLYVGLARASDDKLLFSQTGTNDEALIRIIWDTSAYAGQNVYIVVVDTSSATSWGHINLDDVRTGCDALGDDGLHFNVLGQSNQPVRNTSDLSTSQIFSVDPIRPQFHYTPYQGWINDPCGLIEWNGRHHLFSQFYPDAPLWNAIHWSHADSADAVHWRELPVALSPIPTNNPQDTSGRFTGSAILDKNSGAMQLIFTDFTNTDIHPNTPPEVVSTAVTTDGVNFTYFSGNPIVALPPAGSLSGFRDPKVFFDTISNTWKMVVGSGDNTSGKIQLFESGSPAGEELTTWNYVGVLTEGDGTTGTMWECPNFFPLDGKWVLFYGGNGQGHYEVGTYDGKTFTAQKTGLLDAGPNIYATQWYIDSQGRNLVISWMNNMATSKFPSRVNGWAGAQSITRELFIRADGGLGSKPIDEVSSLATGPAKDLGRTNVLGNITIGSSNTARLQYVLDLSTTNAPSFTVQLFSSRAESVNLVYTVASQTLTLDTTNAGYGQPGTYSAVISVPSNKLLAFDLLIDRSSLEVFVGDGTSMTTTVFPRYQESTGITIRSPGGQTVFQSISLTPFGSTWS